MLSRSGIHAIRALIHLAELPEGSYAGAVSVAEIIGAPKNYLGKILQQLSRDGVLDSQKGLRGGFRLARPAKDISLFDVVGPTEQLERWDGCILGRPQCSEDNPCPIHNGWKEVRDAYLTLLKDTTIADLAVRGKEVAD